MAWKVSKIALFAQVMVVNRYVILGLFPGGEKSIHLKKSMMFYYSCESDCENDLINELICLGLKNTVSSKMLDCFQFCCYFS